MFRQPYYNEHTACTVEGRRMLSHLWQSVKTVGEGLVQLVYPSLCWVCEQPRAALVEGVCPDCIARLTNDPHPTCPRCSSTVGPYVSLAEGCIHCRDSAFAFDHALRLGPYEGVLRDVVLRLKYREDVAEVIGILWARSARQRLLAWQAHLVVPVPLHWTRRWRRGFNQSEVLARALAHELGLPCRPRLLGRARRTVPQTRQSFAQRRANVHGAFRTQPGLDLRGQTVLLVDDVLTTGSTAHEAARALRTAKPARIIIVVLAHGR